MSRRAVLGLRYTSTRTQTRSTSETAAFQDAANSQPAKQAADRSAARKEDGSVCLVLFFCGVKKTDHLSTGHIIQLQAMARPGKS
jgi:hypothetical protein